MRPVISGSVQQRFLSLSLSPISPLTDAWFILDLCGKEDALSLAVWGGNSLQLEKVQQDLYLEQKQRRAM